MITHLGNYTFPEIHSPQIRKAEKGDSEQLIHFVKHQFSQEWAETIKNGFLIDNPSIYFALSEDSQIIGFAAFDVFKNRKGYFGPMGVSLNSRAKGIGYMLLHYCLKDMKEIGYEYAIFGGAGPIEFYEKSCNAVVIPLFTDRKSYSL
ncbi:GNAT family N-acetyltransferase [Bacillus sp. CGMCC 1.16607]|uniref:GNAT family N-acetyltransferase n=1 Tax=Bacillus sp. CGMCC 1.16607 TaxID=3351842 RepID=UPI00363E9F1B